MTYQISEALIRLTEIIDKGRVDLYKPIQIAEVLYHSRIHGNVDFSDIKTFQNPSLRWRNSVTQRLTGKQSTSSARFQHDVWSETAMPPDMLKLLDEFNKANDAAIEKIIYLRYAERQGTVVGIITYIKNTKSEDFSLPELLKKFISTPGITRSIDKAYEIITYSIFEVLIESLEATICINVSEKHNDLLHEFADIAQVLLGLPPGAISYERPARLYRVGVTNAADRGLDMWANFGPAIQVKHLTLDPGKTNLIIDQIESDSIVIVCRDVDASTIEIITQQIGWGKRVQGIVTESNLVDWYERCLRGKYSEQLAEPLMELLIDGFSAEFPQSLTLQDFMSERGYVKPSEI